MNNKLTSESISFFNRTISIRLLDESVLHRIHSRGAQKVITMHWFVASKPISIKSIQ